MKRSGEEMEIPCELFLLPGVAESKTQGASRVKDELTTEDKDVGVNDRRDCKKRCTALRK